MSLDSFCFVSSVVTIWVQIKFEVMFSLIRQSSSRTMYDVFTASPSFGAGEISVWAAAILYGIDSICSTLDAVASDSNCLGSTSLTESTGDGALTALFFNSGSS